MGTGGMVALATPGGAATDLTILASSLLSLAGLLFLVYIVAVVTGVAYGIVRGPSRGRGSSPAVPATGARR